MNFNTILAVLLAFFKAIPGMVKLIELGKQAQFKSRKSKAVKVQAARTQVMKEIEAATTDEERKRLNEKLGKLVNP